MASEERHLLSIAARHAGLIFEIAGAVRDGLIAVAEGEDGFERLTRRARRWSTPPIFSSSKRARW